MQSIGKSQDGRGAVVGVIRKLRKLLFDGEVTTGTSGAAKAQQSNFPEQSSSVAEVSSIQFDRDLARLLAEMGRDGKPLLAGAIELVGLDEVKATLGKNWDIVAEQAQRIARDEIKRHLSDRDFFKAQSETRFLICFASLNRRQALDKAKLISRAIKARLVEELPEIEENTSVSKFVTEVDPKDISLGDRSLADRLSATLEKMQHEVEMAASNHRRMILKDFRLLFAPMWHTQTQITHLNRCFVDPSIETRAFARIKGMGATIELERTMADLDYMILARALDRVHAAQQAQRSTGVLVPVTQGTLTDPAAMADYRRLLGSIPTLYRQSVVLEISGLEDHHTIDQILTLRDLLQKDIPKVACGLALDSPLLPIFGVGDIYGLGCNLFGLKPRDPATFAKLKAFVAIAREAGAVSYAHSANTLGLASIAFKAGFQYVDGPAVHLASSDPRPAVRLKPMVNAQSGASRAAR
jgi:hypothetical protein